MKETLVALILALILFKSIVKAVNRSDNQSIKFSNENGVFNIWRSKDNMNNEIEIMNEKSHPYSCGCCDHGRYALPRMIIGVCLFVFIFKVIHLAIK